ncbi:MAG: DUF6691 family protein [Haloarculaceae archaeon]
MSRRRHPLFYPLILAGGLLFGFGLAYSHMARPEVVLEFLQLADFGLLFVMGGAAVVTATVFTLSTWFGGSAPLTGRSYHRRIRALDRNVLAGGVIFGVGWGVTGICPGAAFASLGLGNLPIIWAFVGMFVGAYIQGAWRSRRADSDVGTASAD